MPTEEERMKPPPDIGDSFLMEIHVC